jgi:hypothetical protein
VSNANINVNDTITALSNNFLAPNNTGLKEKLINKCNIGIIQNANLFVPLLNAR